MACNKMTFYDFRYFLYFFDYVFVLGGIVENDTDESTYFEAQRPWFYDETWAFNDTGIFHFFYALMDGGTGYTAFTGNLEKRDSGVFDKIGKDFSVNIVNLIFHSMWVKLGNYLKFSML